MFDKEAIAQLQKAEAILNAASTTLVALKEGDESTSGALSLPEEFKVHDLEKFMPMRRRLRGLMVTEALADFAAYSKANAQLGAQTFIGIEQMMATAVLNLGTPEEPGHADNKATFKPQRTAAYNAIINMVQGGPHSQKTTAEFLEDWAPFWKAEHDGEAVTNTQAITAVRNITIEELRKADNSVAQLSAERSAFESIKATSKEKIPTIIHFSCRPYSLLDPRTFALRIGIRTSDKPAITVQIIGAEQHAEDMGQELAQHVRNAIGEAMPVMLGDYRPGN